MSDVMPEELKPDERRTAHPSPRTLERPQLTERRKQIVKFCHEFAVCHGWAASISEISTHIHALYNDVRYDLRALDAMGYIVYAGDRQIRVLWLP
jgi:hypothetical protein